MVGPDGIVDGYGRWGRGTWTACTARSGCRLLILREEGVEILFLLFGSRFGFSLCHSPKQRVKAVWTQQRKAVGLEDGEGKSVMCNTAMLNGHCKMPKLLDYQQLKAIVYQLFTIPRNTPIQ